MSDFENESRRVRYLFPLNLGNRNLVRSQELRLRCLPARFFDLLQIFGRRSHNSVTGGGLHVNAQASRRPMYPR